jgi:hypothetical protein
MTSSRLFLLTLLGTFILWLVPSYVWAQQEEESPENSSDSNLFGDGSSGAPTQKSGKTGVLDFEGETIEGQRKRPDLFLQTETQNLTLDAILYLRKDFNDFHQVDRSRRPGYVERKARKRQ